MKAIALVFVLAGLGFAQATPAPSPNFIVGFGGGYNATAAGHKVNGWTLFGTKISSTAYTTTLTEMTGRTTTIRQGVEQILVKADWLVITTKIDAGVGTNNDTKAVGGAFSTGASVMLEVGRLFRAPGVYIVGSYTYLKVAVEESQPVYRFGFAKTF